MEINNNLNQNQIQTNSNTSKQTYTPKTAGIGQDTVSFITKNSNDKKQSLSSKFTEFKHKFMTFLSNISEKYGFTQSQQTFYNSVYSGFEPHFFELKDNLISKIELNEEQKSILKQRINDFESYKNSLSQEQKTELEKNKHALIDFCLKDGLPDKSFAGYNNFKLKYEQYKTGNFSDMTNEDLAQLLYYVDTTDTISDGKIGSFAQGRTGSCWFLSMLGNYASTKEGEENLSKRISGPDEKGNYTVTFDNPYEQSSKETYSVSAEELKNHDLSDINSSFSSGDVDVRIYEIAIEKLLRKYLAEEGTPYTKTLNSRIEELKSSKDENGENLLDTPGFIIASGEAEKITLVHRALGYKNNPQIFYKKSNELLKDYTTQEYIDKTNAEIYSLELNLKKENGKLKFEPVVKPINYSSLSDILYSPAYANSELICNTGTEEYSDDENECRYISTGHVYNIMTTNKDKGSVVVNDPYNSAFPHAISKEKFDDKMKNLIYLPNKLG